MNNICHVLGNLAKCPLPGLAERQLWECHGGKDQPQDISRRQQGYMSSFHGNRKKRRKYSQVFLPKKFEEIIIHVIFFINLEYEYYYSIWMNNSLFDYY